MRLDEITKDEFKKRLRFPMELVEDVRDTLDRAVGNLNANKDIEAEIEEEWGSDFVSWTVTIQWFKDVHLPTRKPMEMDVMHKGFEKLFNNPHFDGVKVIDITTNQEEYYTIVGIIIEA